MLDIISLFWDWFYKCPICAPPVTRQSGDQGAYFIRKLFSSPTPDPSLWQILIDISTYVEMLAKERHGEHKKLERKNIYIQVTETRYKWTGLDSSSLIGSWESSRVATIVHYARCIRRDCFTWVWWTLINSPLTCIYGEGWVHYVGSITMYCRLSLNIKSWSVCIHFAKIWCYFKKNC